MTEWVFTTAITNAEVEWDVNDSVPNKAVYINGKLPDEIQTLHYMHHKESYKNT